MSEFNKNPTEEEIFLSEEYQRLIKKKSISYFPLPSLILSLCLLGLFIVLTEPQLLKFYGPPDIILHFNSKLIIFSTFAIVVLFDTRRYIARKKRAINQLNDLKSYLSKVWISKKKQQQKANVFSNHAAKLKLFISDKLLEFIEYDEKFLHFKGIAAEVRHNGVISYDKVVTALNKAIEQQAFLAIYEQSKSSDDEPSTHTLESLSQYQIAIDAMRYLWDLLDLSTADNMALHIGNQLIECEEHYYQLNLDTEKKLHITQSIPISPTFFPQLAVLKTLSLLTEEVEIRDIISLANINSKVLNESHRFDNTQFRLSLEPTSELLGNPNHIILLLENLIKNAQFFSQKTRHKQKSDRIGIRLKPGIGFAHFTIYNRGPLIQAENLEKLFQLGFSTRRTRQYHGKGLGLFFAQEIVNGYQGKIEVTNIESSNCRYQLISTRASGEVFTHNIEVAMIENKLLIKLENTDEWKSEFNMESDIPLTKIEVLNAEDIRTKTEVDISASESIDWVDPCNPMLPRWHIQITAYRKQHKLAFKPLYTEGVQFDILLPTADSCLHEQEVDFSLYKEE